MMNISFKYICFFACLLSFGQYHATGAENLDAYALMDIAKDSIRPVPPTVDYVTVDTATGLSTTYYIPSTSADVGRYILFKKINNLNIWVDSTTIFPGMPYIFAYPASQPQVEAESYAVAARDTANNLSGYSEYHTTMFLTGAYDSCALSITLNWSPYIGWGDDLQHYRILTSVNDSAYRLFSDVADTANQSIVHHIKAEQKYCFIIEAVRKDGVTSFSNEICFTINAQSLPENLNADFATVDGEHILLSYSYTPADFNNFALVKNNNELSAADTISWFNLPSSSSEFTFYDTEADISLVNTYKIISFNACGRAVKESNIAANIVLQAQMTGNSTRLQWNGYEQWYGGIEDYEIYRITSDGNQTLLATVDATTYTDNLASLDKNNISSEICYRVKANEGSTNPHNIRGTSESDISCITFIPSILVPNAFTPNNDGRNDEIKPVIDIIPEAYHFSIFDRFGNRVFETTNYTEGWRGETAFGTKATQGVYLYLLTVKLADGTEIMQDGSITVLYP